MNDAAYSLSPSDLRAAIERAHIERSNETFRLIASLRRLLSRTPSKALDQTTAVPA